MEDSSICVRSILPSNSVVSMCFPIHGFTQLGLRSYPSGSFVPEAITTLFSFLRPDRPVYATASVRPVGPCQPTAAMAGPVFSYLWNPYPSVSGGIYDFHGRLHSGVLKVIGASLHHWATVLQGHQVTIATDNSTVVSYIIKQGGTRSHTLLCLVVELFM